MTHHYHDDLTLPTVQRLIPLLSPMLCSFSSFRRFLWEVTKIWLGLSLSVDDGVCVKVFA